MFLAILSRIRSRIFLGDSGDGNGWIYVDGTSGVEVAYMSERASEILILPHDKLLRVYTT